MRGLLIAMGLMLSANAFGQSTPTTLGHSVIAKPAHPKKSAKATTPVVAPRHTKLRKPVHAAVPAAIVAAKPAPVPAKPARPPIPADEGTVTHLHLPRYVSLRSDEVNMRSGPGERYPVLWQYRRKELPVRIEREFDIWRLVEDMDGIKGWVHQATLTGRRTFITIGTEPQTLRAEANDTADAVALVKPGVVGRLLGCAANAAWCHVQIGDYGGFLPRTSFWGTDAGEAVPGP